MVKHSLITCLSANNSTTRTAHLCRRHCVKASAANSKAQVNHVSFSQSPLATNRLYIWNASFPPACQLCLPPHRQTNSRGWHGHNGPAWYVLCLGRNSNCSSLSNRRSLTSCNILVSRIFSNNLPIVSNRLIGRMDDGCAGSFTGLSMEITRACFQTGGK